MKLVFLDCLRRSDTPVMANMRNLRGCQGNILWIYAAVMIPLCFILVFTTPAFSVTNFLKNGFSLTNYPSTTILSDGEIVHAGNEDLLQSTRSKDQTEKSQDSGSLETTANKLASAGDTQQLCSKEEFFIPDKFLNNCYVTPPEGYRIPFNRADRLWNTPRKNLGWLNTSEHDYNNQVHNQRWARIDENNVRLRENGGTSVRAFGDNIIYYNLLVKRTGWFSRCRNKTKPVVLDTGAGVASVAAVARDKRYGNNSVSVLSYVPVDEYLRLGNIISERGLPVYLHYFTAEEQIPVPDGSFDVVHCRWCWHHNAGYDVWLKEMDRILVPGGAFVFTFVPLKDEDLLPHKPWFEALDKMPWDCERHDRIIQVCIKNTEGLSMPKCALTGSTPNEKNITSHITKAFDVIHSKSDLIDDVDRVININCPLASICDLIDRTIKKQNTMNTFSTKQSNSNQLATLLHSGKLGILHDWTKPGPFYPRMFDVVNILCAEDEKITSGLLNEIHRILRPNGFAISSESTCKKFSSIRKLADELYFSIAHEKDGILVLQRK